jgi:hypothetical protein
MLATICSLQLVRGRTPMKHEITFLAKELGKFHRNHLPHNDRFKWFILFDEDKDLYDAIPKSTRIKWDM